MVWMNIRVSAAPKMVARDSELWKKVLRETEVHSGL